MAECDWGITWCVLNLICGLAITAANLFWALDGYFCGWYQLFFGVAIVWVSITTKCCDKYALAWFPFFGGNFLFTGCTFLYLACGAYWCFGNDCGWWGFCFFFVFVVGVIYVILWLVITLAGVNIPEPKPLESCCGGDGDGYQKMDDS
eukprot:264487_1